MSPGTGSGAVHGAGAAVPALDPWSATDKQRASWRAVGKPYSDLALPGRLDIRGVEWWATDPYPCWFRSEGDHLVVRDSSTIGWVNPGIRAEHPVAWDDEADRATVRDSLLGHLAALCERRSDSLAAAIANLIGDQGAATTDRELLRLAYARLEQMRSRMSPRR